MKKTILVAALAAAAISAQPVLAQQPKPAEKSVQAQAAPNVAEFDKQVAQMDENLKQMDALMEKIHKAKNPQERQQLLQQYWLAMQHSMGMMHGLLGPGGMGCCMGGPGMGRGMMGGRGWAGQGWAVAGWVAPAWGKA